MTLSGCQLRPLTQKAQTSCRGLCCFQKKIYICIYIYMQICTIYNLIYTERDMIYVLSFTFNQAYQSRTLSLSTTNNSLCAFRNCCLSLSKSMKDEEQRERKLASSGQTRMQARVVFREYRSITLLQSV